jgi:hypothetical protein
MRRHLLAAAALVAGVYIGCGTAGAPGTGGGSGGSPGTGGTDGSGSGGASGSGATTGDANLPDVKFTYDGPSFDGSEDACAATTVKAEALPLDMYIIFDKSGSMHAPMTGCGPCGGGFPGCLTANCGDCDVGGTVGSKWCRSINALNGFFSAGTSVGMGVALQYFSGSSCGALSSPAVPLQILPSHLTQLQTSLNSISPSGGTPTGSAASGIVQFTNANQQPGRKMIGVIITDGDPTDCGDPVAINGTLAAHFTNTGIPTFIVGMDGATYSALQTMANGAGAAQHTNYCGGGITPCHFYNVGNGDPNAFIDAMKAIQQSALGCSFNVPRPDGGAPDWTKVQVKYTAGTGGTQTIPNVPTVNDCANGGFYYDNNTNPTTINICPSTCSVIQADNQAKIDVELPCLGS